MLRGAGFPARHVLDLAAADYSKSVDDWLLLDAEVAAQRAHLIGRCKAVDARTELGASLKPVLKRLFQQRVPDPIAEPALESFRSALAALTAKRDAIRAELPTQNQQAQLGIARALNVHAASDRFRTALLWQNRSAVHSGVDALLRRPLKASDSKTRQNRRLVASYIQRYCVKNDTIGFFGPTGWARFTDDGSAASQQPGAAFLDHRIVFYEYWAIDALATKLSADPEVRPYIAPRRLPQFRLQGTTLHYPIAQRAELPPEIAAVASRCDGVRLARDIAAELVQTRIVQSESEVYDALDELVQANIVLWALEIPTANPYPERHLIALLERVDAPAARERGLQLVAQFEQRRAAITAAQTAPELEAALIQFEVTFSQATDANAQRAHGQTYAGRTPLFEECRRDTDVSFGRPFVDRLGPPLELLLRSARWFTHEIAARYRAALLQICLRLQVDGRIEFSRFWHEVRSLFPGGRTPGSIVANVREELQRRWATLLSIAPDERSVQRSAATLRDAVLSTFEAPGPGWPSARNHSPDIMVSARGPEALARGELRLVLGEMHSGFNTIVGPFIRLHPRPEELVAGREHDIGRICIAPVWSKAITNSDYYSPSPRDLDLEVGIARSARPRNQVIATSELEVELRGSDVRVRTLDGSHSFDVIEFLEHHLIAESFAEFSAMASAPWTPRVTIDDLVIARETWRFPPNTIAWATLEDPIDRFVEARRWSRTHGLPRWLFVKSVDEVKPTFVDFASPLFIDMLAKVVRGSSGLTISEMLPGVDETWLIDAAGELYTAELRLAAVDPERWTEPA